MRTRVIRYSGALCNNKTQMAHTLNTSVTIANPFPDAVKSDHIHTNDVRTGGGGGGGGVGGG